MKKAETARYAAAVHMDLHTVPSVLYSYGDTLTDNSNRVGEQLRSVELVMQSRRGEFAGSPTIF